MKQSYKHLFTIILNIFCTIGLLFSMAEAIININPYINMLWLFISIILFCIIMYLNQKYIDNLTK